MIAITVQSQRTGSLLSTRNHRADTIRRLTRSCRHRLLSPCKLLGVAVFSVITWYSPSLRADEPKQLNMLYVGVEANIDSVRDGAQKVRGADRRSHQY